MNIGSIGKSFDCKPYPQNKPLDEREYLVVVLFNGVYITASRFYKDNNFILTNEDEIIISFCIMTMEEIYNSISY